MRSGASRRQSVVVAALGTTHTLAWASSYYLPAIIADPVAADLGISRSAVFGAFSGALLLTAMLGPAVGRAIDNRGGRGILVLSNLVLATGLTLLALSHGIVGLGVAWAVLGVGMALGLYDTAFATLAGLYGVAARAPMTGITLFAGFASTIGWPATLLFDDAFGWRGACLVWAAINLLVALPLNRFLVPAAPPPEHSRAPREEAGPPAPRFALAILAFVFTAVFFVAGAMAAHLPRLLQVTGATSSAAVAAAALVGPAQVGARLAEFALLRHIHPVISARLAAMLHPLAAGCLALWGAPASIAFALLHGAGTGMLTIARGTLPLAIFGAAGYGLRTGIMAAPARIAGAVAPLLFGILLDEVGWAALAASSALSLAAAAALMMLRLPSRGD
ncbi:MAG TPA: MFS transporter [Stellaceae bacterium]|nr:MFS transporter [Stellaceae bacterium]